MGDEGLIEFCRGYKNGSVPFFYKYNDDDCIVRVLKDSYASPLFRWLVMELMGTKSMDARRVAQVVFWLKTCSVFVEPVSMGGRAAEEDGDAWQEFLDAVEMGFLCAPTNGYHFILYQDARGQIFSRFDAANEQVHPHNVCFWHHFVKHFNVTSAAPYVDMKQVSDDLMAIEPKAAAEEEDLFAPLETSTTCATVLGQLMSELDKWI